MSAMFFPAGLAAPGGDAATREAGAVLEAGGVVAVIDGTASAGRGRGFLLGVAALASETMVNLMVTWGRGLTCFSVTAERAMALGLVLAGEYRDGYRGPILLRSVEAAECEGTGISAADRAMTLRAAGAPDAGITSLKSPGHVMPAMIGYRGREHRASADIGLDLVRHLTLHEVAAWTDILDDEGDVASGDYCLAMADRLGLVSLRIEAVFGAGALGDGKAGGDSA